MRCRVAHDPFTKLGENFFALHGLLHDNAGVRAGQCADAFSAPKPVFARTSSSVNIFSAFGSGLLINVPTTAPRNPSGMLTIPGFSNGKIGARWIKCVGPEPMMLGPMMISTSELSNPIASPQT